MVIDLKHLTNIHSQSQELSGNERYNFIGESIGVDSSSINYFMLKDVASMMMASEAVSPRLGELCTTYFIIKALSFLHSNTINVTFDNDSIHRNYELISKMHRELEDNEETN